MWISRERRKFKGINCLQKKKKFLKIISNKDESELIDKHFFLEKLNTVTAESVLYLYRKLLGCKINKIKLGEKRGNIILGKM